MIKQLTKIISGISLLMALAITNIAGAAEELRIVSVGGGATETIAALGGEKYLVGVDTSSTFPPEVTKLPQVGYQRTLAPEGILSLKPTVLVGTSSTGPATTLEHVKKAGVKLIILPSIPNVETVKLRIDEVANLLNAKDAGDALWKKVETDLNAAKQAQKNNKRAKKVLFLLAVPGKAPLVAGNKTEADTMIELAGARNVAATFGGYQSITPEALQELNPEVILITDDGLAAIGGQDQLWKLPGINHTTAAKNKAVISMDTGFLLNFGPRTGQAVLELTNSFASP
jgi:iron complex transport system substrate-binding protein